MTPCDCDRYIERLPRTEWPFETTLEIERTPTRPPLDVPTACRVVDVYGLPVRVTVRQDGAYCWDWRPIGDPWSAKPIERRIFWPGGSLTVRPLDAPPLELSDADHDDLDPDVDRFVSDLIAEGLVR